MTAELTLMGESLRLELRQKAAEAGSRYRELKAKAFDQGLVVYEAEQRLEEAISARDDFESKKSAVLKEYLMLLLQSGLKMYEVVEVCHAADTTAHLFFIGYPRYEVREFSWDQQNQLVVLTVKASYDLGMKHPDGEKFPGAVLYNLFHVMHPDPLGIQKFLITNGFVDGQEFVYGDRVYNTAEFLE